MAKTKSIEIEGKTFVLGKLVLDEIEELEKTDQAPAGGHQSLTSFHAAARKAVAQSLARGGVTDPSEVGKLDVDDLTILMAHVVVHSGMAVPLGEVVRSLVSGIGPRSEGSSPENSASSLPS